MMFSGPGGMPDRPWEFGPEGAVRYLCPFDCGWHYDEPSTTRLVARSLDPDAITDAINDQVRRRAAETDAAVREHLTEHTAAVVLSTDEA